jgi:hypothetical protein
MFGLNVNALVWHGAVGHVEPRTYFTHNESNERWIDFTLTLNSDSMMVFEFVNITSRTMYLHVFDVKDGNRQLITNGSAGARVRHLPPWSGLVKLESGGKNSFVYTSLASQQHANTPHHLEFVDLDTHEILVHRVNVIVDELVPGAGHLTQIPG